jgi:uncharacterized protein YebE (UPF0316 family)
MIKVVNVRTDEYDVFIGRPSKWGNPFKIGRDGNRKEVLEKYRTYLINNKELMADITSLDDMVLGCYCKPKACHGDIIAEWLLRDPFEDL